MVVLLLVAGAAGAHGDGHSLAPLVERVRPGVVNVQAYFTRGSSSRALGSGFIVDPEGYAITNAHVVEDASDVRVVLADRRTLHARVVGADAESDVALLKIDDAGPLPALALGDSDRLRVGDPVFAIGNPFGLGTTVTAGIVSAKERHIGEGAYDDVIQTDAPINPGNSGGPMFDEAGLVIGISSAVAEDGQGIGFAIPIETARAVAEELRARGRVVRGWIGVGVQDITPELAPLFHAPDTRGALVADVTPGGPAARAGVRVGDLIVKFGAGSIDDSSRLPRAVAATPPGQRMPLELLREGARVQTSITVEKSPEESPVKKGPAAPPSHPNKPALGVQVVPGVGDHGVVIAKVEPGGPSAGALTPGDVILEVDRSPVRTPAQVNAAVLRHTGKAGPVLLRVQRSKRIVFVAIGL
jgi:serine protease Do